MRELIGTEVIADIATGALLFIGTLVLLTLLSHAISRGVRDSAIGGLDRALGFVFGLLRGAVLVCLVYIGALWFWSAEQLPRAITEAKAMPLVRDRSEEHTSELQSLMRISYAVFSLKKKKQKKYTH